MRKLTKTWFTFEFAPWVLFRDWDLMRDYWIVGEYRRFSIFSSNLSLGWSKIYRTLNGQWYWRCHELIGLEHVKPDNIRCNLCGGPWHNVSGHLNLEKGEVWCGVCARDMVNFLRHQLQRRTGGGKKSLRFYDYIGPKEPT